MALDGFGGILFADENFQEAQFCLDPLVLPVLLQHWHPVLLLNISIAAEGDKPQETTRQLSVLPYSLRGP